MGWLYLWHVHVYMEMCIVLYPDTISVFITNALMLELIWECSTGCHYQSSKHNETTVEFHILSGCPWRMCYEVSYTYRQAFQLVGHAHRIEFSSGWYLLHLATSDDPRQKTVSLQWVMSIPTLDHTLVKHSLPFNQCVGCGSTDWHSLQFLAAALTVALEIVESIFLTMSVLCC